MRNLLIPRIESSAGTRVLCVYDCAIKCTSDSASQIDIYANNTRRMRSIEFVCIHLRIRYVYVRTRYTALVSIFLLPLMIFRLFTQTNIKSISIKMTRLKKKVKRRFLSRFFCKVLYLVKVGRVFLRSFFSTDDVRIEMPRCRSFVMRSQNILQGRQNYITNLICSRNVATYLRSFQGRMNGKESCTFEDRKEK